MTNRFTRGVLSENPVFVLTLGLCPSLAITTKVTNALGMGAGVTFVLLGTATVVSLLRESLPRRYQLPAYLLITAIFVTIFDLAMRALTPGLSSDLGIYVPLIAVNCIILGRASAVAQRNGVADSVLDALGMSVGFTLALLLISLIREVLGSGTITLPAAGSFDGVLRLPGISAAPVRVMGLSVGAFLVMGYLKAFFNWIESRRRGETEK